MSDEKLSPFAFIKSVTGEKNYLFSEEAGGADKEYVPYIVNKGLSFGPDTLLFAAEMTKYGDLPKKTQYDFYFYGIPKKFRKMPWHKKDSTPEGLKAVQEYYHCNATRAEEYLKLLSSEQMEHIQTVISHGGRSPTKAK